ncbi:tetratricopeptide repeat protein [Gryllotalpicola koreensis]|uniref:Tetratricopeptide repeat protein n=1 Tax=Gryllotalpicola koreensis TaxID=993086 RepID=A0ABP8A753_9MICO
MKTFGSRRVVAAIAGALVVGSALAGCTNGSASAKHPSSSAAPTSTQAALENQMLQNGIKQAGAGKYDDATSTFKAIVALDAKNKYALYNLGLIAQIQGDKDGALDNYDKAIAVDPKFTSALYNKAIVLEPSDRKQAESIYEQIVKIDPKASTSFLRLSYLYQADGDQAKADAAKQSALKLDPSLATVTPTPGQ